MTQKYPKYQKNNQWKYLNKLGELRNKRKNEEDKNTQEQLDIANIIVDKLSNSTPSAPPIWLLIYGIGIIIFSVFLFSLRAGLRIFLIFMVIGLALSIFWLYLYLRSRQQNRTRNIAKQPCICPICNHKETGYCIQQKCACCIIMKGETVIGHNNNPLQ